MGNANSAANRPVVLRLLSGVAPDRLWTTPIRPPASVGVSCLD
ncbi:hypothetical protein UO65_1086 [Actinokineospora spheciospongiae]|uniref:Uncharacterized protein n=1 Tax=Actinokineospora spheciospongiae TaxID=909613 RepID=W7JBI0_9PSEU|nr:hypothetical protein UO65_1086 [Actinokineospora spheciospongiae]